MLEFSVKGFNTDIITMVKKAKISTLEERKRGKEREREKL